MVITTTAVAFITLSLGLGLCGLRFFKAFRKIGGQQAGKRISVLLSSHLIASAFVLGMLGLGSLIFAKNSEALYGILLSSHFPLTLATALGVYLIFYIFFPRSSPWLAVPVPIVLGTIVIILTHIAHPLPFMDARGGIDWNMPRSLSILLSYLVFLQIGATLYIFCRLFFHAPSREVRNFSLFIATLSLLALVNHSVRFTLFVISAPDVRTQIYDVILLLIGIFFVIAFLLPALKRREHQ